MMIFVPGLRRKKSPGNQRFCRIFAMALTLLPAVLQAAPFDVKAYGAKGDGKTPDRDSINKTIQAAAAAGGGTVYFPAGTYLTGSIQLRSNITLQFEPGTRLEASADPSAYDAPEPNEWDKFQDFGHSHFHNSLIWGENLENVSIVGAGFHAPIAARIKRLRSNSRAMSRCAISPS
jgi:polygalacturonase